MGENLPQFSGVKIKNDPNNHIGLVAAFHPNPLGLHGVVQWPKELIHKMPGEDEGSRWRALLLKVRLVGKGGRVFTALLFVAIDVAGCLFKRKKSHQ